MSPFAQEIDWFHAAVMEHFDECWRAQLDVAYERQRKQRQADADE